MELNFILVLFWLKLLSQAMQFGFFGEQYCLFLSKESKKLFFLQYEVQAILSVIDLWIYISMKFLGFCLKRVRGIRFFFFDFIKFATFTSSIVQEIFYSDKSIKFALFIEKLFSYFISKPCSLTFFPKFIKFILFFNSVVDRGVLISKISYKKSFVGDYSRLDS